MAEVEVLEKFNQSDTRILVGEIIEIYTAECVNSRIQKLFLVRTLTSKFYFTNDIPGANEQNLQLGDTIQFNIDIHEFYYNVKKIITSYPKKRS